MTNFRQTQSLQDLSDDECARLLVAGVTDYAIYLLTLEGLVRSWNAGAERFKGYTANEIIGQHFSIFYSDEDRRHGLPARALQTVREDGRFEGEGWRVRKDGTRFWANVVIDPIRDTTGELIGYAKITRDVTERRAAQKALRESEQQFRLLVQGVTDYAIYMLSPTGIVSNWNSGAQRIKGYKEQEVIGKHFSCFYTDADKEQGIPAIALATAEKDGRYEKEGWRVRRDGSRFWAHVVIDAIRDPSGTLVGFAKVTRDITERKIISEELERAKAALYQSQKMEAIGQLTGGVAHDFNNSLQVIAGNLQLLRDALGDNPDANRRLDNALGGVKRGARLASQLLSFARKQPLEPAVLDVGSLIRETGNILRQTIGEAVELEVVVSAGLWHTIADPIQLENALLNLAINARDAMSGVGKLTIECSNAFIDDRYAAQHAEVQAGQYVLVAVSDTGGGMPPEVVAQAFDPFFTTKPVGQGTGLGLSMVYGFIKQTGGHVSIYSEIGHGSTVKMYLPRSQSTVVTHRESVTPALIGGNETILVVEDDAQVRDTVADILKQQGYTVLKASDAAAALAIIESGVVIDLLFTDVVMPGELRSPELARRAKAAIPNLAVLFTSGYTENAIVHSGRLDAGVALLSKPYQQEDLAHKVRAVLATRERADRATPGARSSDMKPDQIPGSSTLSVLVVEDDDDARALLVEMLRENRLQVDGCGNGERAVEMLKSRRYDVLMTDVQLPGMNGFALAELARGMGPLNVVYVSGHARSTDIGPHDVWLQKPFSLSDLESVFDGLGTRLQLSRDAAS